MDSLPPFSRGIQTQVNHGPANTDWNELILNLPATVISSLKNLETLKARRRYFLENKEVKEIAELFKNREFRENISIDSLCESLTDKQNNWIKGMCESQIGNPETLCLIDLIGIDLMNHWNAIKQNIEDIIPDLTLLEQMIKMDFTKNQVKICTEKTLNENLEVINTALAQSEPIILKFFKRYNFTYTSLDFLNQPLSEREKELYIDEHYLYSPSKLKEMNTSSQESIKKLIDTLNRSVLIIFKTMKDVECSNPKSKKIKEKINNKIISLLKNSTQMNGSFENFKDLWNNKKIADLLLKRNIKIIAEVLNETDPAETNHAELLVPQNIEEAVQGCKKLLQYGDLLFMKAVKTSEGSNFQLLIELFPEEISLDNLVAYTKNIDGVIARLLEQSMFLVENIELAKAGEITHEQYCEENGIKKLSNKNQKQFIAQLFNLNSQTLMSQYAINDVKGIIEQIFAMKNKKLADLRARSIQQLRSNFRELKELIEKKQPSLPHTSEKRLESFQQEVHQDLAQLFTRITQQFSSNFFVELSKISNSISPIIELNTLPRLTSILKYEEVVIENIPNELQILTEYRNKHLFRIEQLLEQIENEEEKKSLVHEAKTIISNEFLPFLRLIFLIKDSEAILGHFTEEDLENETYLLPKPCIDFLDFKGINELLGKFCSSDQSTEEQISSEEEQELKEVAEIEQVQPPYYSKSHNSSSSSSPNSSHSSSSSSLSKECKPRKGEKLRKYKQRINEIKKKLGIYMVRKNGSHEQYKRNNGGGTATIPFHGGGSSIKRRTAKSIGDQFARIVEKKG